MTAIEQQTWQEVGTLTWGELFPHQWLDFRIALMDVETEQEGKGVVVERSYTTAIVPTEMKAQGVSVLQSPAVISTRTEMIVSIVVSNRDYKTQMMSYLPPYERKSKAFNEILNAFDKEFRNLEQLLSITERNTFLDTAIESLPTFERDLGIKTDVNLKYDQRREQIVSRLRSSFDQTTEETIAEVASAYGNGEVEVSKTSVVGVYDINFIGLGIPNNLSGLKEALDVIIPAHLGLTYTFSFTPWGELVNQTWGAVASETWDELRMWEGAI